MNYKNEILNSKYLGKGSSRKVYLLESGGVLKVAINEKGIAQNYAEYLLCDNSEFLNEVYSLSDCHKYLECEFCEKVKGIAEIKKYIHWKTIHDQEEVYWNSEIDQKDKNVNFQKLLEFLENNLQILVGDSKRPSSWGKNINGNYVLIDYGCTKKVYEEFYSYKARNKNRY